MKTISGTIGLLAIATLAACGGTSLPQIPMEMEPEPPTAYEQLQTQRVAQSQFLGEVFSTARQNLPDPNNLPRFSLPTAPGSATYTAIGYITSNDAERAAGNPRLLAYGTGELAVTFDATDPTMTGSLSDFVSRDSVNLDGTISIVSTGSRHTSDSRLGLNAFFGTSTGTITGTGTGTILDTPRSFDGEFSAFVVGDQGEGFNVVLDRMVNGELVQVGGAEAVRNP